MRKVDKKIPGNVEHFLKFIGFLAVTKHMTIQKGYNCAERLPHQILNRTFELISFK